MDTKEASGATNPGVEAFLDSCLEAKGVKPSSEELKQQMLQDLASRLNEWLLTATFNYLNEQDTKDMEELMERGAGQEEVMAFLRHRLSNIDEIYAEEMEKFKKVYVGA